MSIFGGIITNGLIAYFDANYPNCLQYDGQQYYLESLIKNKKAITTNIILGDYGLTAYDVGRANNLTGTTNLLQSNNKLILYAIDSNDSTGGTQTNLYSVVTATTMNRVYLELSGGYFQNFYKLDGYNWELLPYRYNNGFTLETWLSIDNTTSSMTANNNGVFLYLGTRAENKFTTFYSGDSGYTTSGGIVLGPDNTLDLEDGIYDNAIAFLINEFQQIGYKYINYTGLTVENYSDNPLTIGWKHIAITYTPCLIYPDEFNGGLCGNSPQDTRFETSWYDIVDCLPRREGRLAFYVNGRLFYEESCFTEEFWFTALNTDSEKQIGVPFNVSWGGGTFGLQNSYHYGMTQGVFEIDHTKDDLLLQQNFNGGFYGGISTLRIYQKPLNIDEIRLNYNQEAPSFGLNQFKGGRVIRTF